jgi:hypothetical protein
MEKLDRPGWAAGMSITSYGVRIGIRVNKPEVLEQIRCYLPPGWKSAPTSIVERLYSLRVGGNGSRPNLRHFNLLYGDLVRLARTDNPGELFERFEADLQLYVAEMARGRLFVHAGTVGWKGQAILIPGPSFSGKTTLVAELVKAGATYYSDEYAVLDRNGHVHAYSKPLAIRDPDNGIQVRHPIESLGGRVGAKALPVGLVVVSNYRPGAHWRYRRLSAGEGLLKLLANTVSAQRQPEVALATLHKVMTSAPAIRAIRGEANSAIRPILDLIG